MLIRKLQFENLLSFGKLDLELQPLNVFIGPNGSGKSNVIAAISLLRAAAADLNSEIVNGGGANSWIRSGQDSAGIGFHFDLPSAKQYHLMFGAQEGALSISGETVEGLDQLVFARKGGSVTIAGFPERMPIFVQTTALSQLRGLSGPAETRELADSIGKIEIYHGFDTGPRSQTRTGAHVSLEKNRLVDGGYNLALLIDQENFRDGTRLLNSKLKRFCAHFREVKSNFEGGLRQIYMDEEGGRFAATRLSDGTLKFLCLMVVLLNPTPPPLICIEEPESGLHPDAMRIVAEALVDASERTQLIVTTHSDSLVDGLSNQPESVVVCERDDAGGSQFQRLDPVKLKEWLENYSLGEVWRSGEIGGNRW